MRKIINAGLGTYSLRFRAESGAITVFKKKNRKSVLRSGKQRLKQLRQQKESKLPAHYSLPAS